MMADLVSTADRLDAVALVQRSFYLIDHGGASETAHLFAADASLTFGPGSPAPGRISGADIALSMTKRQAMTHVTSRHVLTNIIVTGLGNDEVAVTSLLTLFRSEDEGRDAIVRSVADIEDRLIRDGAEWKISQRLISPIFMSA